MDTPGGLQNKTFLTEQGLYKIFVKIFCKYEMKYKNMKYMMYFI